ncbi:hypothetical protein CEXT_115541 [Caerostris extrusa]|uniref:Uncharacterized protein n=1 Tax=Caerostris extrusa TaxID=172846 RepID=A0AAV4TLG4_CAEEX|nr:hypothetical protein CEXT_115541 [Caerostris extrusa]
MSISLEVPDSLVSVVQFCRKDIEAKCATDCTEEKCKKRRVALTWPWWLYCKGKKEVLYRNSHCANMQSHGAPAVFAVVDAAGNDNIGVKEGLFRIVLRGRIMSRYR